ncbi:MAG: sialate O-acetylesterase [Verrucomicrobiota bacterium]
MKNFPRLFSLLVFLCLPALDVIADPSSKPLKIFILAGQSNMQGHARVDTIDAMALDPKTAELGKKMKEEDGSFRVCERVWISSIGSSDTEKTGKLTIGYGPSQRGPKIGPEFAFGITMEELLPDHPILIIKTAWGGKSLHTDFRPPSAPPYEFNESQLDTFKKQGKDIDEIRESKAEASGQYYKLMLDHVKSVLSDPKRVYPDYNPEVGFEVAGFVWFQGWNDMVDRGTYPNREQPGGYDSYSKLMAQFIRDIRNDLEVPEMPFVIGVLGVNGPTKLYGPDQQRHVSVHQNFRDAMAAPAALPEFKGNVTAVLTEEYWDLEVSALRKQEQEIKRQEKKLKEEGKLGRAALSSAVEKLYTKTFNEEELDLLRNSVSNAEYHYLGSARILGPIGEGFAEAMVEMLRD